MWSHLALCLFVGLTYGSINTPAWKENTDYVYQINGRTLSSLHEASNDYSGIFLRGKLHISLLSSGENSGTLQGRITQAQSAQIQSHLPNGWKTSVPESQLNYKSLDLSGKPFQITTENGLIKNLIVEEDLSNWEANLIKSFISQFQLDLKGRRNIRRSSDIFPDNERFNGVFSCMEQTVTGETETLYEIHPLPEYLIQSIPSLVPLPKLRGGDDGEIVEVLKFKNYTRAEERPSYHYGFGHIEDAEPTSNKMAQFFVRESESRIILTGKLSRYTVQSSVTINKIMMNPMFKNHEMGSVISVVNLTLSEVKTQQELLPVLSNPTDIGNLVYTYESVKNNNNKVHQKFESLWNEQDDSESSDEESSNDDDEISQEAKRGRRMTRSISRMNIQKSLLKDSEESMQQQQQQQQPKPTMSEAAASPLLPLMSGNRGQSIRNDFPLKDNVQKLVQQIGGEIQDPEKVLKEATLQKYIMLNKWVRLMNEQEIHAVAEQIYSQSDEQDAARRGAWSVFRDSVAAAGSGPAFLNIQQWIEKKLIQNGEAGAVLETMAASVRVPTEEYMRKFFEQIVQKPEVQQQAQLNESAVLSYTNLVYRVYVNRNESHNQYPVHAFGEFDTKKGRQFVKTSIIPYLRQQLDAAVSEADARKIHVYIRALGNVGHPQILQAYEPYLEGKKQISEVQRTLMVLSMQHLCVSKPEVARSVLHKIYQNAGEVATMRIAAAHEFVHYCNPSAEMLQHMAQQTNVDAQDHVNAAVKFLLISASRLPAEWSELRNAAQSAVPLLTKREFGGAQSVEELREYVVKNFGNEYHHFMRITADDQSTKFMGLEISENLHGMEQKLFNVAVGVSSIKELMNSLSRLTHHEQKAKTQRSQEQSNDGKWASANIAKLLQYQYEEGEQFEAVIMGEIEHIQKLWSFDNHTIEQLPELIRKQEEWLKDGGKNKRMSYTKLQHSKEMALSFPTESGFPFLYTYDVPILIRSEVDLKAVANPQISRNNMLHRPDQISMEIGAYVTVSAKIQSELSFVTPYDRQVYTAGYERNLQAHLPIKAKIDLDLTSKKEMTVEWEIEELHENARMLHFSSVPYTSRNDVMTIKPISLRPNTLIIKSGLNEHQTVDHEFGQQQIGVMFRLWGHLPRQRFSVMDIAQILTNSGVNSIWDQLSDRVTMQHSELNLAFIPNRSATRKLTLRMKFGQKFVQKPEQSTQTALTNVAELAKMLEQEETRQETLRNHIGSGIKSAQISDCEISLSDDAQKFNYLIGAIVAKSNAHSQSRFLAYYKNQQENTYLVCDDANTIPNTNGLDLTTSWTREPKAEFDSRILYGKPTQSEEQWTRIATSVKMSRSNARKEYLMHEDRLTAICQQQGNNKILHACQNSMIQANLLDQIEFNVKHGNVNENWLRTGKTVFESLIAYYYPIVEIASSSSSSGQGNHVVKGKIEFQPQDLKQVNITVQTAEREWKFVNISMHNNIVRNLLVPHPVFHLGARIMALQTGEMNIRPTCVVDQTAAQTFKNTTYPLSLDEHYTVLLQYVPKRAHQNNDQHSVEAQLKMQLENYVVLARKTSSGQEKEVIISFNHQKTQGKTVEIQMKPSTDGNGPTVTVNGQQVQFNEEQIADLNTIINNDDGLVEIYALPNGEVKCEIHDAFYVIYDGKRVKITATNNNNGKLRNSIYGLCGRFSEDQHEDFTVPRKCVVRDSNKFAKNYEIDQQHRRQDGNNDDDDCVVKNLPLYVNVISDRDAGRTETVHGQSGIKLRTRYVEENGTICFTLHPVTVCNAGAARTTMKNVPVHCVEGTKTAYYFKSQIDQGGNPDFSRKLRTKTLRMEIPVQCN